MGSGGRGVDFTVRAREEELGMVIEWRDVGWVGAGWGKVCVKEEWEGGLGEREGEEQEYQFEVEGVSELFGTVATVNHTFIVSFPSSSSLSRQISDFSCAPSLWDTSPFSLYGIQTYPSGLVLLPPLLRSSTLTITTKALSPCLDIGMSKDILAQFSFDWVFLDPIPDGLVGVNANDWVTGGGAVMRVPSLFLEDRRTFPMNEPVGIQVTFMYYLLLLLLFFF